MPAPMASEDHPQPGIKAPPRVGDALSLYAWIWPARPIARHGLAADVLAGAAAVAGALAFLLFWRGDYWFGLLPAILSVIIELAAEISEPRHSWREIPATLVPLFWWWAWGHGLDGYGHPLGPVYGIMVVWAAVVGSAADVAVGRLFERRFGGTVLSEWRPFDSRFALVAAGPGTNLLILALSLIISRPGSGLVVVGWWTIATVIIHAIRLAQAGEQAMRGKPIRSWLHQ